MSNGVVYVSYINEPRQKREFCNGFNEESREYSWVSEATHILYFITSLLELPVEIFHRFLLSEKSSDLLAFINSYLQNAPRLHFKKSSLRNQPPKVAHLESVINYNALGIILRLSENPHEEEEKETLSEAGGCVDSKFCRDRINNIKKHVFTIPNIMDMCVLFSQYEDVLRKLISRIYCTAKDQHTQLQFDRLSTCLSEDLYLCDAMNVCRRKLFSDASRISYLVDVSHSLSSFLTFLPTACPYTLTSQEMIMATARYLENILFHECSREKCGRSHQKLLKVEEDRLLHFITQNCLQILHKSCYLFFLRHFDSVPAKFAKSGLNFELLGLANSYLSTLTDMLKFNRVMLLLNQRMDLMQTLTDISLKTSINFDTTRLLHIRQTISLLSNEVEARAAGEIRSQERAAGKAEEESATSSKSLEGIDADISHSVKMESLTSSIRDLFPDLSEEYVKKCLLYFNGSSEIVIDKILNGSIPPQVHTVDLKKVNLNSCQQQTQISSPSQSQNPFSSSQESKKLEKSAQKVSQDSKNQEIIRDEVKFFSIEPEREKKDEFIKPRNKHASFKEKRHQIESLYNDEYDDTYDNEGIGIMEPENI